MPYPRAALRPALIAIAIAAAAALVWLVASSSASDDDASRGGVRRQGDVLRELPELRTRASRTYSTGRGTRITRAYAAPVNYRAGGEWKPIDDDLVPSSTTGVALENAANSYTLSLPDALDGRPVEVREGEDYVRFALDGAKGSPDGGGVEARYADALPGVDVAYEARADSVKESLVLGGADAGSKFVFALDLSDGLHARENDRGGIDFVRDGEVRMSFAPPYMRDSAREPATSTAVSLELRGDEVVLRAE
jgi:hypothetical protein